MKSTLDKHSRLIVVLLVVQALTVMVLSIVTAMTWQNDQDIEILRAEVTAASTCNDKLANCLADWWVNNG